jgi:hypothetical protein
LVGEVSAKGFGRRYPLSGPRIHAAASGVGKKNDKANTCEQSAFHSLLSRQCSPGANRRLTITLGEEN